jgi:hypothetical protein
VPRLIENPEREAVCDLGWVTSQRPVPMRLDGAEPVFQRQRLEEDAFTCGVCDLDTQDDNLAQPDGG